MKPVAISLLLSLLLPAAAAAQQTPDPRIKQAVAELRSEKRAVRQAAMRRLVEFGAAALAMARIGEPALPHLIDALRGDNSVVVATWALRRVGKPAIDALIAETNAPLAPARARAMRALGRLEERAAAAIPALIAKLDVEEDVMAAALALGDLGASAERAIPKLVELLAAWDRKRDRSWAAASFENYVAAVRENRTFSRGASIATALGKIGPPALEPLIEQLFTGSESTRLLAALALGRMGASAKSATGAIEILDDPARSGALFAAELAATARCRSR